MALSSRTFGVEFEVFFEHNKIVDIIYDYPKLFERQIINANAFFQEDNKPNTRETAYGYAKAYGASELFDLDYYQIVERLLKALKLPGWKLHEDVSIEGPNPIEIVTPPLQGMAGINQVVKFCNVFGKYASVNDSTGLHVHVGAADFLAKNSGAQRLTLALLHFKNFEPLFDSLVNASRRNNKFAASIDNQTEILSNYKQIIKDKARKLNSMLDILTKGERYKKLNLESLAKHKTLEFRQMQGTLNPTIVKNWIVICTSFVDMIIETEESFLGLLKQLSTIPQNKEQEESDNQLLASFKKAFTSNELKSSLIRNLEYGLPIVQNLEKLSSLVKVETNNYYSPDTKAYYYVLSLPKSAFKAAAGFGKEVGGLQEQAMLNNIAWRIRNNLLLTFRTLSTSVQDNKILFYIKNESATEKLNKVQVSPEEAESILTAQKNLATKTGMPKGIPSRAIRSIQNIS